MPRPKPRRSIPKHWSPDEARQFLALHESDRLWPVWAFLLGSDVRIGELVFLARSNVDLEKPLVRVNEFAGVLGCDVHRSGGKSRQAIRTAAAVDRYCDIAAYFLRHRTKGSTP